MSELEKLIERIFTIVHTNSDFKKAKDTLVEVLKSYRIELHHQNDELRDINQVLWETKQEYERLFMDAPVGFLIVNRAGIIEKANHYSHHIFRSLIPYQSELQHFISEKDQERFYSFFQQLNSDHLATSFSFQTRTEPVKNIKFLQKLSRSNETVIHLAVIDETELVTYQKKIQYMSEHDALTGVYNRHYYEQLIERLNNELTEHFGVIFLDINGLKMMNGAFGHDFGDELIKRAVEITKAQLDETMYLSRIGGDEFVIIMTETSEDLMKSFVQNLKEKAKQVKVKDIQLSIAFGFSYKRKEDQTLLKLIHLAEDRMYQNKLYTKSSGRKDIIGGILAVLHEKKPREKEHGERVSFLAEQFGKVLDLNQTDIYRLKTAGLLHDIGKVAVDHTILDKTTRLDTKEKREMKQHPEMGFRILQASQEFKSIADIVLAHHEFFDGTGYPRQLKGEEIPYLSRILAICDTYDAMTKERPYSVAVSKEMAMNELNQHKGTQFDPELVEVFIHKVLKQLNE
ncbi:HD-GYP domain-containing protein [Halolactibacillus alkaliphilus]|nr:HD domain-containing phosphohydrolase [Halolactibacillus alkaliphilus]SFO84861.1 diguanylate cyclase (GGDEF) domain-containing protein/HDIG domain-containing protein [Halolactibacillus alkaliphilus]